MENDFVTEIRRKVMRVGHKGIILIAIVLLVMTAGAAGAQDTNRGGELFVTYCAMCHGLDGRGRVGADLNEFPGIDAEAAIEQVILEGISGSAMPAFGRDRGGPLTAADAEDISAYLIGVLNGTEPIAPAPIYEAPDIPPLPDIEGDPSNGAVVFQENCAVCHGEESQGGIGKSLAKTWPGTQPEAYLTDVISRGIRGSVMPGWAHEHGGPLTESEVADMVAYTLSLEPIESISESESEPAGPFNLTISIIMFAVIGAAILLALVLYYRRA